MLRLCFKYSMTANGTKLFLENNHGTELNIDSSFQVCGRRLRPRPRRPCEARRPRSDRGQLPLPAGQAGRLHLGNLPLSPPRQQRRPPGRAGNELVTIYFDYYTIIVY